MSEQIALRTRIKAIKSVVDAEVPTPIPEGTYVTEVTGSDNLNVKLEVAEGPFAGSVLWVPKFRFPQLTVKVAHKVYPEKSDA